MARSALALSGDCRGLTDKQRRFVAEYTIDYNAARAARVAGYKNPGQQGKKLLDGKSFPKVARAVGKIQKQNLEEAIISKEDIIKELSSIAMRDPLEMCDENGLLVIDDMRKIPAHIRRAIDSVKVKTYTDYETGNTRQEFEVKLVGKATAFRMLMEHFGMFAAQEHKHDVSLNWEDLFNETRKSVDVVEGKIEAVRKRNKRLKGD